ncbi:hypothetical protein RHMOL_Rhmol09G0055000 [Rhododendron molle]|uniref:Uncharacterized protein n=1 Tax=Rhododendron molle TaxID=49168 RepID=A0ACC0M9Z6_RHOML|nr:hypothetical protein RHMOL_Rhmol09G0055000 [Rhododendron molle]
MEVPKSTTAADKGKHKLGEVPADLWDVNEDPQVVPTSGNVHNITRSGRIFQPANLQTGTSSNPSNPRNDPIPFPRSAPLELPSTDLIQKQLERIPAAISIWGLICSSREHRQMLCHALSRLEIQADITPEAMMSLILPPTSKHTVVFTDKDLPVEGVDHNRPLHITVKCRGLWVPTVLIDNGSAINVCPMRVAYRLGFAKKDFAPSNLAVKGYDGTRRMVEGTLMLKLDAEGFEMDVEFHVVDIPATFNLLLGRPWLHRSDIMAVPSTLHQKVMLGLPTGTLTICGDSGIRPLKEDGTPVLGIMHGEEDVDLGGFSFDTSGSVLAINVDGDFLISSVAMDIMLRMSYFPGLGLGIRQQGVPEFPIFPFCEGRFGLGYTASADNTKRRKHTGKPRTLYGDPDSYFVREVGKAAYTGQAEPFINPETGELLPGFENPSVLMPPVPRKPLILYLSVNPSSMGCLLAQEGDKGVEKAIYYLSKKMVGCEERYTALEKTCWALVWASKKLRHYMLAYPVKLISRMDPLNYLFQKPALTGKLARWLLMLAEFDLEYVTRKSVKGRAVAEFLADHPVDGPEDSNFTFTDEEVLTVVDDVWTLYFDGVANQKGYGIGVLLITPDGSHIPLAFKLNFDVTNNQAEYEACIVGMEAALTLGVEKLEVIGDSNLVVSQANGDWKVREERLKPYHQDLEDLIPHFNKVTFTHIPRLRNQFVDALATLASMVELPLGVKLRPILIEQQDCPAYQYVSTINDINDGLPWYHDIWNFVERGEYPAEASKKDQLALRRLATHYIICGGKACRDPITGCISCVSVVLKPPK